MNIKEQLKKIQQLRIDDEIQILLQGMDKLSFPAITKISEFCGFNAKDDLVNDLLLEYSRSDLTLDDLIEELKQEVINRQNKPEGHSLKFSREKNYIPEAEDDII